MKLPSNDHNIEAHHREHYPTRSNGIIPTWLKGESKAAAKYQSEWIDSMTPEEREQLRQYNEQLVKDREHGEYY